AKEEGVDVVSGSSRGYSAPKDIPEGAKQELEDSFKELEDDEDFQEGLEDLGLPMDIKIGEEYEELLKNEEKEAEKLWEEVEDESCQRGLEDIGMPMDIKIEKEYKKDLKNEEKEAEKLGEEVEDEYDEDYA